MAPTVTNGPATPAYKARRFDIQERRTAAAVPLADQRLLLLLGLCRIVWDEGLEAEDEVTIVLLCRAWLWDPVAELFGRVLV